MNDPRDNTWTTPTRGDATGGGEPPAVDSPPVPGSEEVALRHFLAPRLDPHVGRARRHFEAALAAEPWAPAPMPLRPASSRHDGWDWRWSFGALLAAAAAVAFGIGLWNGPGAWPGGSGYQTPSLAQVTGEPAGPLTPVQYSERWEARDLGTYVLDGKPVQAVHRQQWQSSQYKAKGGYTVQIELPREELVLVDTPVQ